MSGKRNWGDNMTNRMDGKEAPAVFESVKKIPSKLWKKKYKCKKNKDDHTFEIFKINIFSHWRFTPIGWVRDIYRWGSPLGYWVEWSCTACNKRATEWRIPEKKFDRYRHTIWDSK